MTASAFSNLLSFDLGSTPSPDEIESELQLLGLLRVAGMSQAANRRLETLAARAPYADSVVEAQSAAKERRAVDEWLAEHHGDALRTLIPSASVNTDGQPRFVVAMPRDGDEALMEAIRAELSGQGADGELRNFLDEVLVDDLAYIDFDPGVGFAALTAATAPVPATAVCAVTDHAGTVLALDAAVEASGLTENVRVLRNVNATVTVDTLASSLMSDAREFVVHAGIASVVPAVAQGALTAIRDGRVSAMTWRSVQRVGDHLMDDHTFAHEIDNAGTVLAVLGFTHFALTQVGDDVELVPLAAVAGNTIIVSLSREYLSRRT
jgi:hypothetical protein